MSLETDPKAAMILPNAAWIKVCEAINEITEMPQYVSACCCSISRGLLRTLSDTIIGTNKVVLSIGCGSGMLEALLALWMENRINITISGVEVKGSEVFALPESMVEYVPGTFALSSLAKTAHVWMFVYPRDPRLLSKYLSEHGDGEVEKVIWLGPRADWDNFADVFKGYKDWTAPVFLDDCGLVSYELLVLVHKHEQIVA
ncbi:MAG: hypothetical protein M1821_004814 [Bathelium mastoideum]|nr:MAG: hypothetical protein M1821_004814 [Bathelium mastoideum]KAI9692225.1 MAG: hypothetical protein M1822_006455 [Bathelium mastoideum]